MKILTESSLLYWLLCFIVGILLFQTPYFLFFSIACIMVIASAFLLKKKLEKMRYYLLMGPLFCWSGYLQMDNYFPTENRNFTEHEVFFTGKVVEQLSTENTWNSTLVQLQAYKTTDGWKSTSEKVLLIIENKAATFHKNALLLFNTKLNLINRRNNPGEFNAPYYWLSKGVRYQSFVGEHQLKVVQAGELNWFEQLITQSRNYSSDLLDKWIGEADAPLIKAILLGDKSDIDADTKRVFINTGTMHMLAVSGLHIGVIVMLLGLFFKYLFFHRGRVIASIIMLILLWFYAFLTGFSASVVRAVVMFSILILARFLKRDYQPINALSLSAFVILLINPLSIFDIGFQLSYLAMVGIFTYYPLLEPLVTIQQPLLKTVWQGTAVGLAAQAFTVPISLYYFSQFPNYFFISNLGVMLFSGIMLGFSIGLLLVGKIPFIAAPIGWILALSCVLFVGFITWIETFSGAVAYGFSPSVLWVLLTYAVVIIALFWIEKHKWHWVALSFIPLIGWAQWERYHNMNQQEWVVFNTNHPTFIINKGGEQICLYAGKEKGKKNALRLVADYQKLHPGSAEFIPLEKGTYQIKNTSGKPITIENKFGVICIYHAKNKYALIVNSSMDIQQFTNYQLIAFKKMYIVPTYHDLSKGALRVEM